MQTACDRMLETLGRFVILSHEQQLEAGRLVRRWLDWEGGPDAAPPGLRRAGMRAKRRLIETNMRLVVSIARKYQGLGLPIEDLVQEGAIGLSRAAELYDPSRGYAFSTYSYWWIRQAMTRGLSNFSGAIRIPANLGNQLRNVEAFLQRQQHCDVPTKDEEICKAMKISPAQLELLRTAAMRRSVTSLDKRVGDDLNLWEAIPCPKSTDDPIEAVESSLQLAILERLLPRLTEREQAVIHRMYLQSATASDIASEMGITRGRVGDLERKARAKLQKWVAQGLADEPTPPTALPPPALEDWEGPVPQALDQLALLEVPVTKARHQPRRPYRRQNNDPAPGQMALLGIEEGAGHPDLDPNESGSCSTSPPGRTARRLATTGGRLLKP